VVTQAEQRTEQATVIEAMRVELAALRRPVGRDASNSAPPPSRSGRGAKAKARAENRAQRRGADDGPDAGKAGSTGEAGSTASWNAASAR
jgi:hypothetical protein